MCNAIRLLFLLISGVPYKIQKFTFLLCINRILTSVSSIPHASAYVGKEEYVSV